MGKLFLLFCFLSFGYNNISAQNKTSASASTSATIVTAVGTYQTAAMNFGKFTSAGVASKIRLSCEGLQATKGKINLIDQQGCAAAIFNVMGDNSTYSVSLSFDPLLINTADNKESMKIDLYKIDLSTQGNIHSEKMETITLGADLEIGSAQMNGNYRPVNPYYLTVNFN